MTKPLILIVEGEARMQALYQAIFGRHEDRFAFQVVYTGEAALEFLEEKPADLVVLAAELPRMPGLDVLQVVRARPATKAVPVIIVSAAENAEERLAALRIGADHYQGQNFAVEELLARIRRLLQRGRRSWSWPEFVNSLFYVAHGRSHHE